MNISTTGFVRLFECRLFSIFRLSLRLSQRRIRLILHMVSHLRWDCYSEGETEEVYIGCADGEINWKIATSIFEGGYINF